jgi:hypothetical protein
MEIIAWREDQGSYWAEKAHPLALGSFEGCDKAPMCCETRREMPHRVLRPADAVRHPPPRQYWIRSVNNLALAAFTPGRSYGRLHASAA